MSKVRDMQYSDLNRIELDILLGEVVERLLELEVLPL